MFVPWGGVGEGVRVFGREQAKGPRTRILQEIQPPEVSELENQEPEPVLDTLEKASAIILWCVIILAVDVAAVKGVAYFREMSRDLQIRSMIQGYLLILFISALSKFEIAYSFYRELSNVPKDVRAKLEDHMRDKR